MKPCFEPSLRCIKKGLLHTKQIFTRRWCKNMYVVPKTEDTAAWRKGPKGEKEKCRGSTGTVVWAGVCGVGLSSWESGLNLTAGNTTTVCLQAVTEAQAALRAAPHTSQLKHFPHRWRKWCHWAAHQACLCFLSLHEGDQGTKETYVVFVSNASI